MYLNFAPLSLTVALLSVRMGTFLKDELEYDNITQFYWTDSRVVLGYISNDSKRFHVFVGNRVQQIRDGSDISQWRYVNTSVNPADEGSRGVSPEDFLAKSKWLHGPDFIWTSDLGCDTEINATLDPHDPELRKVQVLHTHSGFLPTDFELTRFDYFSNWFSLKRAIALCLRFKANLRSPMKVLGPVTVEELQRAEKEIIRIVQCHAFKDEIALLQRPDKDITLKQSSSIYGLDPFLDKEGILRVGGRIRRAKVSVDIKHPMIIPKHGHVTNLIIAFFHDKISHQGCGLTINRIRSSGYWIIACSAAVRKHIFNCVPCRRLRRPVQGQKMADLPTDRLDSAPPFSYCGVDFFGPWVVKDGRKEMKRYGSLFTCLQSRAVHIEVATSLSTDSFINCLRRFISIRGPIRTLRCDCGTNFVGARNELNASVKEFDEDSIKRFLLSNDCDLIDFKFNTPNASHMGGIWERQIRTTRAVLNSLLRNVGTQLDDDSLRTFMYEAAAIVNSRPLTVDSANDPLSLAPLTPNQILTMKHDVVLPPLGNFENTDLYSKKRWRRVQHLANEFWKRWRKEYLQNLQVRSKWNKTLPNVEIDDVVIVCDDDLPRSRWRLGRVVETFPSKDGLVCSVRLSMGSRSLDKTGRPTSPPCFLNRPIHKVVLLMKASSK